MNKTAASILVIVIIVGALLLLSNRNNGTDLTASPSVSPKETVSPGASPAASSGMQMQKQTPTALTAEQQKQQEDALKGTAPKTVTFNVDGGNFFFTPNMMRVKKGDTVKIVFKNVGGFHDLKIDEFNVATKQIQAGQTDTIQFVANKTGTFEYYCSVGSHRALGMVGKLVVE